MAILNSCPLGCYHVDVTMEGKKTQQRKLRGKYVTSIETRVVKQRDTGIDDRPLGRNIDIYIAVQTKGQKSR